MNKLKPTTVFKILGFILLGIGVFFLVWGIPDFGNFDVNGFATMGKITAGVFLVFFSVGFLSVGFRPEITKLNSKIQSETMNHAGKDITAAATQTAEVIAPAIATAAKAVKSGMSAPTIYCKHCGKAIDADSKFCKYCAKEQ
jgi:hypothetical protein